MKQTNVTKLLAFAGVLSCMSTITAMFYLFTTSHISPALLCCTVLACVVAISISCFVITVV